MRSVERQELYIASQKNIRNDLYKRAHVVGSRIRKAKLKLQDICPHEEYTIVAKSWSEVKMRTAYWQEKVCNRCGKTIGTRNQETSMTEWS